MELSRFSKTIALILIFAAVFTLAACGGGESGIPNGKYESDGSGSFTYFDFKGGNVEIGSGYGGVTVSNETVKYTYKDGTLSFTVGGIPFDLPCTINGTLLTVGTDKYYKDGVQNGGSQNGNNDGGKSPSETNKPNVDTTVYDGVYSGVSASDPDVMVLTIKDGTYTIDYKVPSWSVATSEITDYDFIQTTWVYTQTLLVHRKDSYFLLMNATKDSDYERLISEGGTIELIIEGGKSLYEYELDDLASSLPAITNTHKTGDHTTADTLSITDNKLYTSSLYTPLPESDVLNNVKAVYYDDQVRVYFVITTNGELWAWGNNMYGCLGDGTGVDRDSPVKVLDNVADVICDGYKIYAITLDGNLYRWGLFDSIVSGTPIYAPELLSTDVAELFEISYNNYGFSAVILKTNGDLIAETVTTADNSKQTNLLLHKVKSYAKHTGKSGAAFIVLSDDSLWYYPQFLKSGMSAKRQLANLECEKLFDDAFIYTNENGYVADTWVVLTGTGELYGKGKNNNGQLGDGTKIDRNDWVKIADNVAFYTVPDIWVSEASYTKTDGTVWKWTSDDPTPKQAD